MVAVVGIDPQLAHDLEAVLAPIVDIDQRVVERRAVVAREGVAAPQRLRGCEDVGADDIGQEPLEFAIGERNPVELLELLAEVILEGQTIVDIRPMSVLEVAELRDEVLLDLGFMGGHH